MHHLYRSPETRVDGLHTVMHWSTVRVDDRAVFTVPGGRGWLITDPEYFGNALRTVLDGFRIEVAP